MSEMTVDNALQIGHDLMWSTGDERCDAIRALAAEVRRLRATIERVRALPGISLHEWLQREDDRILDRGDVLAALEGE